jgi:hypothetical protein
MMPTNVKGTTAPISSAAINHPIPAPVSQAAVPARKLTMAKGACSKVARL